jgi:hypothetical protein
MNGLQTNSMRFYAELYVERECLGNLFHGHSQLYPTDQAG